MTSPAEYWFIFQNDRLLFFSDNSLLTSSHIDDFKFKFRCHYHIGHFSDKNIYCAELDASFTIPADFKSVPLKKALELVGDDWYSIAAKSYGILHWDRMHQFCGACSSETMRVEGRFERVCQSCGHVFYPRISPSIIVLVEREETILMARSPHFPAGAYGLIAGFVEAGESIEDAVHREVMEEVGIKINNLRYFGSQAWPFPDSLMLGFFADYESGEIQLNDGEIEEAGWYTIDCLPGRPSNGVSIANRMIDAVMRD